MHVETAGAVAMHLQDGEVDVCLVNMPYCPITRPSLALGVLKACLKGTGITCAVDYANLYFAEQFDVQTLRVIATSRNEHLVGEWTFANAAFPEHRTAVEDTIGRAAIADLLERKPEKKAKLDAVLGVWNRVRDLTPAFVDATARRVLARRPRIVGCTSTFEQQAASLALLRRVKQLDPTVITMLGGANCEAEMGVAVVRNFPWVDFAVSGEADEIFAPLCKMLLKSGLKVPTIFLPHGVLCAANIKAGRYGPGHASAPRAVVEGMDRTPVPDFDDYFATLHALPSVLAAVVPALPVETSRGCWWGQKSHCTFCGLNGDGMRYRSKSHDRVLSELDALSTRYGVTSFQMADNILDMQHLRTVMPALAEAGAPYDLFYEIKANLKREQVASLSAAGVSKVQPGIESLHDGLLKLMAKGSTAAINIELLKHARENGISTVWLMLVGFPGEEDSWHTEVAAWLPLLYHLQPPADVVAVRFDRFSVYHQDPARHGLDLQPYPAYSLVYPVSPEKLHDLAYFFRDGNSPEVKLDPPGVSALRMAVLHWLQEFARPLPPVLSVADRGDAIEIFDTRPVAVARRTTLTGLEAETYRQCEPATARHAVRKRVAEALGVSEDEVEAAIASLEAKRIVIDLHGKLVALCIPGEVPKLGGLEDGPGGWAKGYDLPFQAALNIAIARLDELERAAAAPASLPVGAPVKAWAGGSAGTHAASAKESRSEELAVEEPAALALPGTEA